MNLGVARALSFELCARGSLVLVKLLVFGMTAPFFLFAFSVKQTCPNRRLVIVSKRISGLEEAMRIRRYLYIHENEDTLLASSACCISVCGNKGGTKPIY